MRVRGFADMCANRHVLVCLWIPAGVCACVCTLLYVCICVSAHVFVTASVYRVFKLIFAPETCYGRWTPTMTEARLTVGHSNTHGAFTKP